MITAKVTSKGQITLPKKIRERLGVGPGEDVGFEEKDNLLSSVKWSPNLHSINGSAH